MFTNNSSFLHLSFQGVARRIKEGKGETGNSIQAIIESADNMQKIVYDVLDMINLTILLCVITSQSRKETGWRHGKRGEHDEFPHC